jgi:hypothetical protein
MINGIFMVNIVCFTQILIIDIQYALQESVEYCTASVVSIHENIPRSLSVIFDYMQR